MSLSVVFDFLRLTLGVTLMADPLKKVAPTHMVLSPALVSTSSGLTAVIVIGTPNSLHGNSGHSTLIFYSVANNYMIDELSTFTSPVCSI